jgi:hypothetical protein
MRAFWDIAPCSLVGVDRRFRGACCLYHEGDETSQVKISYTNPLKPNGKYVPAALMLSNSSFCMYGLSINRYYFLEHC